MSLQLTPPIIPPPAQPTAALAVDQSVDPVSVENPAEPARFTPLALLRGAPAWFVSAVLHAVLLLASAFLSFHEPASTRREIRLSIDDKPPVHLSAPKPLVPIIPPVPPIESTVVSRQSPLELPIPTVEPVLTQRLIRPESALANVRYFAGWGGGDTAAVAMPKRGGGIEGREPERRKQLGEKYGASEDSELAVESALDWLVAHQNNDGSWDFDLSDSPCNGRCRNPRTNPDGQATPKTAATGLALLPFLGAGYSHQSGRHAEVVRRGLYYLRGQMRKAAVGRELMHGSMYGHGIASLAVAEALAMTGDDELEPMVSDLRDFSLNAQHSAGGWRYKPQQPGDMTVTGWQVMALKSCEIADRQMPIPTLTRARVDVFLSSLASHEGSRFGYLKPGEEPTATAVGLLMKMYLNTPPQDAAIREGCHYLYELGPSKTNVYFNYYATMTLHHARFYQFPEWNRRMRDHLVRTQASKGHEKGSWHFPDRFGNVGGRLYSTAMCALVLETYYRYLPLWKEAEFPL